MGDKKESVLLTGGSHGMGASHAKSLAQNGWHVCVADLVDARELVTAIVNLGGTASFHRLDVTRAESWESLTNELSDANYRLTGLVNNAGISHRCSISDTNDDDWRHVIDVNLSGPFYGMRAIAPILKQNGGGSIVNIASTSALIGYHAAAYTASKWGLRGLTKTAAAEYAPWHVRVNSIHPGLINTRMVKDADAFVSSSIESIPASRAGEPEEISSAVVFLLSSASSYMTGSEVVLDGGLTGAGTYWRINNEAANRSLGGDL